MEKSTDPKTGYLELPGDLIALTDVMDELISQFQGKPLSFGQRQWLKDNYTAAGKKYNQLAGRKLMMTNISSVIASMNYRSKQSDTLR
jgi:hypothetical protein